MQLGTRNKSVRWRTVPSFSSLSSIMPTKISSVPRILIFPFSPTILWARCSIGLYFIIHIELMVLSILINIWKNGMTDNIVQENKRQYSSNTYHATILMSPSTRFPFLLWSGRILGAALDLLHSLWQLQRTAEPGRWGYWPRDAHCVSWDSSS